MSRHRASSPGPASTTLVAQLVAAGVPSPVAGCTHVPDAVKDAFGKAAEGARLSQVFPGASLVVVPEAGHALGLEAPDAVNEAILHHLGETGPST